jgi:hypothetical protein
VPLTRPPEKRGVNVNEQLTLFDLMPAEAAAPVWSTLSEEERALLVSVLARLMARAVADLGDHSGHPENGHD